MRILLKNGEERVASVCQLGKIATAAGYPIDNGAKEEASYQSTILWKGG
jgi:hypothetical protein